MDRDQIIGEVVRRLVAHFNPERIYLFGSTARQEDHPGSDLDFLVVLPDDAPRELLTSGREYECLSGVPIPVDVVPCRRSSFEARKDWLMSLPAIVLREGRLIYDARPQAA
jgi:predicted nucleotidyltransferase